MPQQFKRWSPAPLHPTTDKTDLHRPPAPERGYDWDWTKLASWYRREHPFCEECARRGIVEAAKVVDHIIPVADAPELRLEVENLQSLCSGCHNVWKRRMEAYARAANQIRKLIEWCRRPETRPRALSINREF